MEALELRQKVTVMEDYLKQFEQTEMPVKHYFAHGTYTRHIFMPAGTIVTGKIHRHSCINIITKGRAKVITEEIEEEIVAPHQFVSGDGIKKILYILEDMEWITVHPWDGPEDLELIEAEVIVPSYEALELERKALEKSE